MSKSLGSDEIIMCTLPTPLLFVTTNSKEPLLGAVELKSTFKSGKCWRKTRCTSVAFLLNTDQDLLRRINSIDIGIDNSIDSKLNGRETGFILNSYQCSTASRGEALEPLEAAAFLGAVAFLPFLAAVGLPVSASSSDSSSFSC